jgi:Rap1a immunity proteins
MPSGDPAHSRTTWTEGLHELLPPGVAALLLAVLVESAQAQTRWDGNRLYAICQQRHDPDSDCAVFIRGTIDRYHELIATHCAPQHIPFSKILERVVADLDASPSTRSLRAHHLILESIGEMSGCPLQGAPDRQ